MKRFQVLDCTLRDGGYVNDWRFGKDTIGGVRNALSKAGVEIAELGFFRDEVYSPDRAVFDTAESMARVIGEKDSDTLYTGLIEMANYYPHEKLSPRFEEGPDAIRYSFWKRLMDDGYEYCARIREKGYLLCCQPTRVEQYSDEEFAAMCERFSALDPYALYIVDTFGLLRKDDLLRYTSIADQSLKKGIILGYHAHDNMGQAFGNAVAFLEHPISSDRVRQVDASIGGIGRGAGNLRTENTLDYLNTVHGASYDLNPVYEAWDRYVSPIGKEFPWGFNMEYFVTASYMCSPNYADYYMKQHLTSVQINKIMQRIEGEDKFLYNDEKAKRFMEEGLA